MTIHDVMVGDMVINMYGFVCVVTERNREYFKVRCLYTEPIDREDQNGVFVVQKDYMHGWHKFTGTLTFKTGKSTDAEIVKWTPDTPHAQFC